ncbi:BLUF domain-containing protein [Stenotrophomonas maltophilia]|uniref:BLUF domain-containing protein n=1 Tax=Stenotrophomonas maltophilia TaxID=40324 RepID=UPI002B1E8186|nr:BLUF domain-containing protein [Stenotrophomonas maltophilia]
MPLRAVAYASEATSGLSMDHVDDLARAAARFNFEAGVTGVLLYDGLRFLQYIEGPEDSINVVYSRISMRLLWVDASEIRSVARSNWDGLSRGGGLRQLSLVVAPHLG